MEITGKNLIASGYSAKGRETYNGYNPGTHEELDETFFDGTAEEVDSALRMAREAFYKYQELSGNNRADFLEAIADEIEALGNDLISRVELETGLPTPSVEESGEGPPVSSGCLLT